MVFLLTDAHGSTRLVVDNDPDSDGDVEILTNGRFTYDAHGNAFCNGQSFSLSSAATFLLYSGELTDPTSGFVLDYAATRGGIVPS